MSNIIQVQAETLQQTHSVIVNNANQINSILSTLLNQVNSMSGSFQGNAAQKYNEYYQQWHKSAGELNHALEGIAQLTMDVLHAFQQQDSDLASKIQL